MKRLVINADDFGFTRDVNRGIIDTHRGGMLTATTLMANGGAFQDAVELARLHPDLSVGCHLVLVQGNSVYRPELPLPATVAGLIGALASGHLDPQREIAAQIEKTLHAGIRPLHLDTHKHTHLHPSVLKAVAWASRQYRIPWVRRPFDFPLHQPVEETPLGKKMISRALTLVRSSMHRTLAESGCKTTDYFAGFQITGRLNPATLVHLFRNIPDGITEFMCHVGYCTEELRAMPTRLKESREVEMRALLDPEVRAALSNVQLTSFTELENELRKTPSGPF